MLGELYLVDAAGDFMSRACYDLHLCLQNLGLVMSKKSRKWNTTATFRYLNVIRRWQNKSVNLYLRQVNLTLRVNRSKTQSKQ